MTRALVGVVLALGAGCAAQPGDPEAASPSGSVDPGSPASSPAQVNATGQFKAASHCRVLGPDELPDGTPPGKARPFRKGHHEDFMTAFGHGQSQVVIGRGQEVLAFTHSQTRRFPRTGGEPVVGEDGIRRWVTAVGDPPSSQITYAYVVSRCPYVMWTQPGLTWNDALAYASGLATVADG